MFTHSNDSNKSQKIAPFEPAKFYEPSNLINLMYARLLPKGIELLCQYYNENFRSNISQFVESDKKNIALALKKIMDKAKDLEDYREAIIIGKNHGIPIIYIKENNIEGFIVADSKGEYPMSLALAASLQKELKKQCYLIKAVRQAAGTGCFADGIVIGSDATRKNENEEYVVPNLLSRFEARSTPHPDEEIKYTLLPDELLRTAQISSFVNDHKEKEGNRIVHIHKGKGETLKQFQDRYTQSGFYLDPNGNRSCRVYAHRPKFKSQEEFKNMMTTGKNSKKNWIEKSLLEYLREKGLKFIDMIEIQFYIKEIKKIAKGSFTPAKIKIFIEEAKQELNKKDNTDVTKPRLHLFTEKFIKNLIQNEKDEVPSNMPNSGEELSKPFPSQK